MLFAVWETRKNILSYRCMKWGGAVGNWTVSVPLYLFCFLEIHQDGGFFYVLVVPVVFVVHCNQGLDFIIAIHMVSSVASCINNAQYAKIIMKLSMKYLPYSLFQKHPISFSQIQKSKFSDS